MENLNNTQTIEKERKNELSRIYRTKEGVTIFTDEYNSVSYAYPHSGNFTENSYELTFLDENTNDEIMSVVGHNTAEIYQKNDLVRMLNLTQDFTTEVERDMLGIDYFEINDSFTLPYEISNIIIAQIKERASIYRSKTDRDTKRLVELNRPPILEELFEIWGL